MTTDKIYKSITALLRSGILGGSRKNIMRMINQGVGGKKLPVKIQPSFAENKQGNRYYITHQDVVDYAKYISHYIRESEGSNDAYYFNRQGLSEKQFLEIEKKQKSKCKICNEKKSLVVDHNHKTKKIRGLICQPCNLKLAKFDFGDNKFLASALKYLKQNDNS